MDITETAKLLFQYGGTVIMAVLFIWVFITDKTKNDNAIQSHTDMLKALTESNQALTESNNNIAKALDIISNNLLTIDHKVDRNYEEIVKGGKQ